MNKKEAQELLSSLTGQLKAEIEVAQTNLKDAQSLTGKIERLHTKATKLIGDLESTESGLPAKLNEATEATSRLTATATNAETELTEIKAELAAVQQNIAAMQAAYTEFQAVKAKIDDPAAGLEIVATHAQFYRDQVQTYSGEAKKLTDDIQANLTTVQQNIAAMQAAYTEFQAVKAKIDDPAAGLEATYQAAQQIQLDIDALQKESNALYTEISRFKDTAAKNVASIQAIKTDSENALTAIKANETESDRLKDKISGVVNLVSGAAHANYFDDRRKRLIYASWAWLVGAVILVLLAAYLADKLIVPLVALNQKHTVDNLLELIIARLSVVTPLLVLSIFAVGQYGKERRLAEQYAFKGVSAITIESSLSLLERSLEKRECDDKDSSIVGFAVGTMANIYAEPQELTKSTKFHFTGNGKLATVGAELNTTLENVGKDLAKAVSDTKE